MKTTLPTRPGPPGIWSRASARAPTITCSTISAALRFRVRPPCPVAQKGQFMPQPAWLEMHIVTRFGYRIRTLSTTAPSNSRHTYLTVVPASHDTCVTGSSRFGASAWASWPRARRRDVGPGVGIVAETAEPLPRDLVGAIPRQPELDDALASLGTGQVGEVHRRLSSPPRLERDVAGAGAPAPPSADCSPRQVTIGTRPKMLNSSQATKALGTSESRRSITRRDRAGLCPCPSPRGRA